MQKLLYQVVFLAASFFILVGEITQKVILFPFKVILFLTKTTLAAIKLASKKLVVKKIPQRHTKLTNIYFWRLKTIRTLPLFFKAFVKGLLFFLTELLNFFFQTLKIILKVLAKCFYFLIIKPLNSISLKIKYFFIGFTICFLIIFFNSAYEFIKGLPSPANIGKLNYPLSSHIYDRNGKLLYEVYREQNRTPIKLSDLPKYVAETSIAIEDKDFYRHSGISPISGVARAIKEMLISKKIQGGSTITQQLVKSALLTPERTITRKIKEMIVALWTERLYTKEQILEMYLNQVSYGGSAYGIEEAAKTYFGKSAKELTVVEAALLAGLPQAPSIYSPYINPKLTKQRRNDVLEKMYKQYFIDKETKENSQQEELNTSPPKTAIRAPHFVFYVKSELEKQYGIQKVEEGGFKITTTLDIDLQNQIEEILREEIEKVTNLNVSNGAILVTRPATGEILAMVGSTDYFALPYGAFNVTTALRQPGSSIKPIMYSLALEKEYTAASVIDDSPIVFNIAGSEQYRPVNYDGKFHGKVTLRYALGNSYNIPAVKILNSVGVDDFIKQARKMGITTWNDPSRFGLSLTLGGGEVKMTDVATAFGVFANEGKKVDLTGVLRMDSSTGDSITEGNNSKKTVINSSVAYIISDILSDNTARQQAFGPRSFLEIPGYKVAVKTGTTDNKKDNWTIGYTPEFLVAVWVGNNDGTPMNPYLASGITGAAPIWNRVMEYLLKNYGSDGKKWFDKPSDVIEKRCYFNRDEYFIKGTEENFCRENLSNLTPTPTRNP